MSTAVLTSPLLLWDWGRTAKRTLTGDAIRSRFHTVGEVNFEAGLRIGVDSVLNFLAKAERKTTCLSVFINSALVLAVAQTVQVQISPVDFFTRPVFRQISLGKINLDIGNAVSSLLSTMCDCPLWESSYPFEVQP